MKKIFASLTIFAAMLAGCQKPELEAPLDVNEAYTATVESFGALTRTSLTSNNQVVWSDGDRLAIFQASTVADEYMVADGCAGLSNASFGMVVEHGTINGDFYAGTEIPGNIALYPYQDDLTLSVVKTDNMRKFDIVNVFLPGTQVYAEKSFGNGAFMMAAVTETFKDHNLKFKNVMGAVKFQFKGTKTVKTVKIEGNNNEMLSGAAVVTVREDNLNPTVKMLQNASTEVILDCGEGVALNETEATEFIIALPPVKFEAGFTVTVTDSNGGVNTVTSNNTDNAILRSGLLVMPAMTLGEGTVEPEPEPDPEVENWSLITSMDEWTADIALEYDGTFYYAKGVELEGENLEAKFRKDADWTVNFGLVSYDVLAGFSPSIDVTLPLSQNAVNIPLPAGKYDVYLDVVNARAWFITDGSYPTPVSYEWGIVGELNAWGNLCEDIPMLATDVDGLFVARAVDMPKGGFKIRANNEWDAHANYGFEVNSTVTADYFYHLLAGGNTRDIYVVDGTYDIWFDVLNTKVYVMTPGKDISDVVLGEPVPVEQEPEPGPGTDPEVPELKGWGISGTNTNDFADGADIMMENDGTWYVARGVEFAEGDRFKIRKDGKWNESFGFVEYGAEFKLNEEITLTSENGYDMFPAAGKYDIYFNPETGKAWFINDGSYPVEGEDPVPGPDPELPSENITLFFHPNNAWMSGNPIFAAWVWATGSEGAWYDMTDVNSDGIYEVSFPNNCDNIIFASMNGEIDWSNKINQTSDLQLPIHGNTYHVATNAWYVLDEGAPETWYIVGNFNGWKTADEDYMMTKGADWYIFKNFKADGQGVKFVADANWNVNRGGVFESGSAIELHQGGADMLVEEGEYDVYLSADASKAYFMKPGETPSL